MKAIRCLLAALLLPVVAALAGFARAAEISVGGRAIVIPTPDGFVSAESAAPAFLDEQQELAPSGVNFLAGFIERADAERLVAGEEPQFERYILLAEMTALKNANISRKEFRALKAEIRKAFDELPEIAERKMAEFERKLSESLPAADFEIDGLIPLGVDREGPDFLSGTFLMKTVLTFGSTKLPSSWSVRFPSFACGKESSSHTSMAAIEREAMRKTSAESRILS